MSLAHGADYLGVVVDVPWTPRSLTVDQAKGIFEKFRPKTFMLTFNRQVDEAYLSAVEKLNPLALQLTGHETPETAGLARASAGRAVYKSIHLPPSGEGDVDVASIQSRMEEYAKAGIDGFILDTSSAGMFGGTGKKSDWGLAARIVAVSPLPVFLAGGINPDNVAEAVKVPGISGIDLASGVEEEKGKKSEAKVARLFSTIAETLKAGR